MKGGVLVGILSFRWSTQRDLRRPVLTPYRKIYFPPFKIINSYLICFPSTFRFVRSLVLRSSQFSASWSFVIAHAFSLQGNFSCKYSNRFTKTWINASFVVPSFKVSNSVVSPIGAFSINWIVWVFLGSSNPGNSYCDLLLIHSYILFLFDYNCF